MAQRLIAAALVFLCAVPTAHAEEPATHLRESIANLKTENIRSSSQPSAQQAVFASSGEQKAAVVVLLALAGLYAGMIVTAAVAQPRGDNGEQIVANGGLVGAIGGGILGLVLTSR